MTEKTSKKLFIRSKVWIEDEHGEVVFGLGRIRILEAVDRLGSLQAAAKELKMGYRAIWGRIRATEERLGEPLLVRTIGGSSGGGSQLTPFARMLLEQFKALHREILSYSDNHFQQNCRLIDKAPDKE
ncbi:MAG: LysR family transcriptional regulator [Desulfobacteraceae bacterium]